MAHYPHVHTVTDPSRRSLALQAEVPFPVVVQLRDRSLSESYVCRAIRFADCICDPFYGIVRGYDDTHAGILSQEKSPPSWSSKRRLAAREDLRLHRYLTSDGMANDS